MTKKNTKMKKSLILIYMLYLIITRYTQFVIILYFKAQKNILLRKINTNFKTK